MQQTYSKVIQSLREKLVEACQDVFGAHLVAIITKGSTVKGGFVPGISDFDLHVYLKAEAFVFSDFLKLELGLSFQERVDPLIRTHDIGGGPIQVIFLNVARPKDWSGPLPGTYLLLYGEDCPEAEPVAEEMLKQDLANLMTPVYGYGLVNSLADKPNDVLADYVRRLNTAVNPSLFRVLSLVTQQPFRVWQMTKFEVIDELGTLDHDVANQVATQARIFYQLATQRQSLETDPDFSRQALRVGFRVLDIAREWAIGLEAEAAP